MKRSTMAVSLSTATLLAAITASSFGQTSYFSLTGDFPVAADKYDFTFSLTRSVGSAEDLRFLTFGQIGGIANAAGDVIPAVSYDGDLSLFDSANALRGTDDLSGPGLDAYLSWTGSEVNLNPNPLAAGGYRLNVSEYLNDEANPFAVDLIGPDDAMVFTGGTPVGTGVANTLKFGSNDGGTALYNHSAGTFTLAGEMIVANTGNAELNVTGGTINVGGLTTVNPGGTVTQSAGSVNANGGLTVDGGTYTRNGGTFNLASGQALTVQGGGVLDWNGTSFSTSTGTSVLVTGAGSVLDNRSGNQTMRLRNGVTTNVTLGGSIAGDYLAVGDTSDATLIVDGADSTLDFTTGTTAGFSHFVGFASTGVLTLSNGAVGTLTDGPGTELRVGASGGNGTVNVLSGADLILQGLDLDETGTGVVTVNDFGSSIILQDSSALSIGSASGSAGTLNVENGAVFTAAHDGVLTINATGTLKVNGGGLFDATPPNAPQLVVGTAGATFTTQGTITLIDGEVRVNGGKGGLASFDAVGANAKVGGAGGNVTVSGGAVNLFGSSVFQARGGAGGNGTFLRWPAVGGVGGVIEVSGGAVTVNDNSTLSVRGGDAGTRSSSFPDVAGGAGGQINVTSGSLTVNGGLVTLEGGNGFAGGAKGAHGSINITGGSFTQNGGEVFTGSFTSAAGLFTHNGGRLTVAGGTFNPNSVNHTINGPSALELPTLVLQDGATAPGITGLLVVGDNNRGRLEILSGASLSSMNPDLGSLAGSEGQALVDGAGSVWNISGFGDLAVGELGKGGLVVSNGGTVNSADDIVVGRGNGSDGTLDVTSGGIVTANNRLFIAESTVATGVVNVNSGGILTTTSGLNVGDGNATLNIDGAGSEVNVGSTLRLQNANATVNLMGGTLTASTISNTSGGAFNFTGGTLVVDTFQAMLVQDGGTLAPGASPGTTNITGDYIMNAGTVAIELGGTTPGTEHDKVNVSFNAQLNGTLDLTLINAYVPNLYDTHTILTANAGYAGKFDNVLGVNYLAGAGLAVTYDGIDVFVTAAKLGDADLDGDVDDADLAVAFSGYSGPGGTGGTWSGGDFDGDGDVDDSDLAQAFSGYTGPLGPSVPEPASLALVALGGLLATRRR